MRATDGSMWTWLPGDEPAFPANDSRLVPFQEKPIRIDCWKYENDEDRILPNVEYIDSSAIGAWAKMDRPKKAQKPPVAGLKLIHMTMMVYSDLLSHGTMDSISQSLGLSPVYYRNATLIAGGYGVFHSGGKDPGMLRCHVRLYTVFDNDSVRNNE